MSDKIIPVIEDKITSGEASEVFEGLAAEVFNLVVSEEDTFQHIGRDLWEAYRKNPEVADSVLIAICGWSMKSILIFAEIIPDDEGLLG